VRKLCAAVIKDALRDLTRHLGGGAHQFPHVVVTVPAGGDLALEYELREVFEDLRVEGTTELDEATAAGIYYLLRPVLLQEFGQRRIDGTTITPAEWYIQNFGLEFDGKSAREAERFDMGKRMRAAAQGPDGAIWMLEDKQGGRLLRLIPWSRENTSTTHDWKCPPPLVRVAWLYPI